MAHSELYTKIMNSRQWRNVRAIQLTREPLCDECKKQGIITAAQCVHHIKEIETARTDDEAWLLATSSNNLQSLCFRCHRLKHTGSHSKDAHKEREGTRLQQWINRHTNGHRKAKDQDTKEQG